MKRNLFFVLILMAVLSTMAIGQDETRLLRFPTVHEDRIVFTYAGDLYIVPTEGGIARRLTSHVGIEMFPRFSPDGSQIAFTGQYDGNTEVYLIPAEGGVPERITFTATLGRDDVSDRMGPNNLVMGWKDNDEVLFRSRMREYNSFNGQLYTVKTGGSLPEQIPVPRGGFTSFSPDKNKIAYNRIFREFRTWKRYRGGMADDVWILDLNSKSLENITNNEAQDIIPMWHGNKVFFLSDRDNNKRMNLFVYDTGSQQTTKLTNFSDFDIKFPSLGDNAIVFENGGYIYRHDISSGNTAKVSVSILDDRTASRGGLTKVKSFISNYEISPDGKRAIIGARGEIFTLPAEHGNTRNLTNTSGIHERNSKWSPDGKWIAYISDESGENELYVMKPDGSEKTQLSRNADTYYFQMYWSPDSKKLLWGDKKMRLRYIDIDSKRITQVADSKLWEIRDHTWSPDSKWIAYSRQEEDSMGKVHLYSLEQDKSFAVSDGWFASFGPSFSDDGKFLYFVSNRDFNPTYSQTEWNHSYSDMGKIYLVTLARDTESPFKPKSDEVAVKEEKPEKTEDKPVEKKADSEESDSKDIKVETDGIQDRIAVLPVAAGFYRNLQSAGNALYYVTANRRSARPSLKMFDFKSLKETDLGNAGGFEISADNKKMLVGQNGSFGIINLPKSKINLTKKLDTNTLEMDLDRHSEWVQIFEESWRQMRDFFYAENMHGLDWEAVKRKYRPLVDHVTHRIDLTYVIGEMISELNVGHAYVGGGDWPKAERIRTGLLGAELEEHSSGYFRIKKILSGQNWDRRLRSPLTEIGVGAQEGDYILAVNGKSTRDMSNPFEAMLNTVGKQVTLTINSSPDSDGARDVVVKPIADESQLYYFNWVRENVRKVNEATNGKVGYVHIPDMGVNGLNEFVKYFYPQLSKKALIIDVRGNGGGNVSPMIIERLQREAAMADMARNVRVPNTDPGAMLFGPKVTLLDEFSASDGDIFPYRFKKMNMGTLIGKRSWGGVVGIRGSLPFTDGGDLRKPEFAPYDIDTGEWIMEGYGVDPDIVVDNDPSEEFAGNDQQLNKAIEVILEQLKEFEKNIPPIPRPPIKR